MIKTCSLESCDKNSKARGYCNLHYLRWFKHGSTDALRRHHRHGMTGTPEFKTWMRMNQRCYNPKHISYKNYGARGIRVCDKWKYDFMAFYIDMGERPTPKHSIDRIDNNGDYEPSNCKWSTKSEQIRNSRHRPTNTGHPGVRYEADRKKFIAIIYIKRKGIHLGRFKNLSDALEARKAAEERFWS